MKRLLTGLLLICLLIFAGCSKKEEKKEPPKAGTDTPTSTTLPPGTSGAGTATAGGVSGGEATAGDTEHDHEDEHEHEEDDEPKNEGGEEDQEEDNEFLKLQNSVCEASDDSCDEYGLNASASDNGFCPYTKQCVEDEDCSIGEILDHFCNCIYQLEQGNSFFNGKEHDCIAEFKAAEDD